MVCGYFVIKNGSSYFIRNDMNFEDISCGIFFNILLEIRAIISRKVSYYLHKIVSVHKPFFHS